MVNNFGMPQFGNYVTNAWNNMNWNTAGNFGNFGTFNNFGTSMWANPWGFPAGGTTKKKSNEELAVECAAEIAKIDEQIAQVQEAKSKMGLIQAPDGSVIEAEAGQQQLQDGTVIEVQSLEEMQKAHKEADTTADGTKVTYAKTEKMTFGQKLMRGFRKVTEGAWGCVKSLVGFEPDGSWNWKKCLKNVAITAACCFAGPIAGTALAACGASAAAVSAVTGAIAVGTRVAATGLKYYSMYKLGEGVYKGCTAETTKEFDESWQQVGTSAFTLFGAKAIQKGLSKVATANINVNSTSTAPSTTTAGATTATQPATFGAKVWNRTLGGFADGIKQDFSLDTWKTTWQGGVASGNAIHSNISEAKGFWGTTKAIGQSLTQDMSVVKKNTANESKQAFENRMQQNKQLLKQQNDALRDKLNGATDAQKPIYEAAIKANENLRAGLDKVQTRQDWANLQTQYRADMESLSTANKWYTRNPKVGGIEPDAATLKSVMEGQELISANLKGLVDARVTSIKAMSKVGNYNKYNDEVNNFGYKRWDGGSRIDTWELTHQTGGAKFKGIGGFALKHGLNIMGGDLAFEVANPISNTPGALWWNGQQVINPLVAATPTEGIDTIWTEDLVKTMDGNFEKIDDGIEALNKQKQAIYKKYENLMA